MSLSITDEEYTDKTEEKKKKSFSTTRGHYTVETEEKKKSFSTTRGKTRKQNAGSGLGYVLKSAGYGLAGVAEGTYDLLAGGYHSLFGDKAYAKYLHEKDNVGTLTQKLNETYNPDKVMKFFGDTAQGVGQSSVFFVPYVGVPLFFTGAAGRGVTEAHQTTGELGIKEYAYGITSSAMETLMEAIVGAGGQFAGSAGKNITARVFKTGGQKAASELVRAGVVKQMLSAATGEFFEEFLGSFADTTLQRAYQIDPNAEYSLADALYSGAVGFASGGFMGGVNISTRAALSHRNGQRIISDGSADSLTRTAAVLQNQIKTEDWSRFSRKSEVGKTLRDLNASLNAYNKLTESERTGTKAALYLGEVQANMAQLELMRSVKAEADKISGNAEAYTDYATRLSGKTITAEDIRNDTNGITGRLAAIAWAGEFMNTESEGSRREAWIRDQISRYADGNSISDIQNQMQNDIQTNTVTDAGVTVGRTADGIDYTVNGYGDRFYELGGKDRNIMTAAAEVNDDGETTYRVAFGKAGEPETSYRVMRKTYTEQELDTVASLAREDAEGFVKQFAGDDIASDTSETRTSGETSAETGTETENTSGDTDGEESKTGETEEETDDKSRNKDTAERESKTSDNSDTSETRTSGEGSKTKAQFSIPPETDNIGTFDRGSKDIRYSIASDNDSAGEQSGYTAAPGNASEDEQAGYNAKEQDTARRYVRDFDALPYETRASVYEFLRSAKGTKADEKTLAAISAIIAASPDLDVRFAGTSRSKPGLIVKEGNAKRQLILLSRDISDTAAIGRTLTAELIHRAENSMAYKALAREVMKNTTESERHAVEERYKDFWTESGENYTKNDIAFEVVSECGADLMSDYNAVRAFATANSSAVRKILETARSICRSLFGKDREAYRRARELTSILAAALDQASALSDSGVSFQYSFDEKAQFSFDGKKSDTTKTDQIRTEAQQTHYLTKDASLDHITGWIKSLAGDREIFGNGRDLNSSAPVLPEGARLHVKNAGEMANKLYLAFYKGMAKNIARDSAALGKIIAENVLVLTGEGKKGTERRTLAEVFGNEAPAIESKIADFMAKKVIGILNGEDAYSYYEQIHADYEAQLRRAQQRFAERETEWQAAMATGNETFKQTLRSIQQILSARDKYKGPYKRKGLLAAPEMDALTEIISKSYSRGRLVPENVRRSLAQFVGFYEATDTREQINAEAAMLNISTDNIRDVCTAAKDLADLYELTDQNRMTADLTKDELTAFANTAAVVAQIYGHYNKYFDTRRKEWVDADANAEKGIKVVQRTIDIEQKQKLPGLKKVVKDFALSLLDPLAVGRMIDGFSTDGVMGEIMEDIVDAENARDARVIRYLKPIRDFLDEHKDYTKRLTAADQMIEFKGTKMTVDEFIQLWMTAHREQALLHLGLGRLEIGTRGGRDDLRVIEPALKADADVSLDERKAPKIEDLMDASQKVAQEIISLGDRVFTDEDREFIALQEKFYNEVASRDKAEADMLFFGMTNVGEKYYIPIVTSNSSRASSVVDARAMMSNFTSLSGQSFNKNTVRGAKNPLSITGSLGVMQNHARGLASYIELYAPMQKLDRIWNTDINHNSQDSLTLRDTAKNAYGDNVHNYLTNLSQDIQGINRKEKNSFETMYARLRSRYAVYQLGLNPKSMLNQIGSMGAIAKYISIPNILKGIPSVTDVDEMTKYSTAAAIRDDGSVKVKAASNSEVIHEKISDILMSGLGWSDARICAMMWGAAQHQIAQDKGFAVGTEDNKIAAGKLLNKMINEVQDTSSASTKTGLARTQNDLFKGLTMFKSAPMKQISRLTEAAGALSMLNARKAAGENISTEQISAAKKELRKTISGFVLQAAYGVAINVLFNYLYNKDPEDGKELAIDFVGQMVSVVPVISEIYDKITSGYDATSFAYDMINETTSAVTSTAKLTVRGLSGDRVSRQDIAKLVYQDAQVVGQFTGMPVRNAYNIITGLVRRLIPSTLGYTIDSATKTKSYNADIRNALASGNTALANTAVNLLYADKKATSVISSAAASEVLRLYGLGYENVLSPTVGDSITLDGETYEIAAADLKKIRKIADGADGAVVSLIDSAIYSTLTDEAKSKAINKTYTAYYDRALSETFGTPVTKADAFARLGDSALIYSAAAFISEIESDKDASGKTVSGSRRKKAEAYLDTLGVSDSQRQLILYAAGYTSDEMKRKVLATVSASDLSDDDFLDVVAALNLE